MKKFNRYKFLIYSVVFLSVFPIKIYAGGIFLYEISSADTRLASAGWSARCEDPSTLFTNPAGMTRLCKKQIELGAQAIFSHVNFLPNSTSSIQGSHGHADIWLPSSSFFYVHPCGKKLNLGIGSLGYFGADLVYNHNWIGRYYTQKTLLEGLSFIPAAAYKINEHWSIGAGLNIMYGIFKQRTAVRSFLNIFPKGYFNLHDYRFGYGGVFGILYEHSCYTRIGIQYLTPVKLRFHNKPRFHQISPLLRNALTDIGLIGGSLNLHVNVPQGVILSIYHILNSHCSLMGNIGWQQWSDFERGVFTLAKLNHKSLKSRLKYQDTWHIALGMECYYSSDLTFSAGIAYDSSAVSPAQRPLNFPIGKQWRFGAGTRWLISPSITLDFSSELEWQGDLKADVNKGLIAGHVCGVFKDTYAIFINFNLIYLF